MTQEQIAENNKLIAEFMGLEWNAYEQLKRNYDSNWSELMAVVSVVEKNADYVKIINNTCTISNSGWAFVINQDRDSKIEAVYYAMVEYIKWKQKLKP